MYTSKQVTKAIQVKKNRLIEKARTKGLYENFGAREVGQLEEKYIDISSYTDDMNNNRKLIASFSDWCMCYDG